MGLADRNYMRGDGAPMRRGRAPGIGGRAVLSITVWLIIINIAVFVVGDVVFNKRVWVPYGHAFFQGVTAEQVANARVPAAEPQFDPNARRGGVFYRPIYTVNPANPNLPGPQIGKEYSILMTRAQAWGHFSTARGFYPGLEVWRFVTFQFLHADVVHLAFNLLGLWFFGPLVEGQLGRKRFAAFYLVSGIFGALLYLLLNFTGNLMVSAGGGVAEIASKVPFLLFDSTYTPLVGASAGIFGVLLAAAYIAPNDRVLIFGVIPAPLRMAVYGFTIISLVSLITGSSNAGGEAAHIGGAIAGAFFIRRMHLLRDFFDVFGDSRPARRPAPGATPSRREPSPDDAEIDRILKKIKEQGIASLTDAERATLRSQSGGG